MTDGRESLPVVMSIENLAELLYKGKDVNNTNSRFGRNQQGRG